MEAVEQAAQAFENPPQLRQDVTTGEWVIMAPQRAQRPYHYRQPTEHSPTDTAASLCPFCPGQEHQTPAPLLVVPPPETSQPWALRVLPNKYPALLPTAPSAAAAASALLPVRSAVGHHEVVVETALHDGAFETFSTSHLTLVLHTWRQRFRTLTALARMQHVLIFKNQGHRAGASLAHPHTQILATPTVPLTTQWRYDRARSYAAEQRHCLLCTVLETERVAKKRVVFEANGYLIWQPYAACFPYETWIVPRLHQASFGSLSEDAFAGLGQALQRVLHSLNKVLDTPAYNLLVRSACNEATEPAYHWYVQLFPRLFTLAGFELATGMAINTVLPEDAAAQLREGE